MRQSSYINPVSFIPAYQKAGYGNYSDYLLSLEWAEKKNQIYETYPYSYYCWICDTRKGLDLHHENYQAIPNEEFNKDVFWICRSCHVWLHRYEDGGKVPLDYDSLKQRRLYMRRQYILHAIRPTTFFPEIKKLIYRVFW